MSKIPIPLYRVKELMERDSRATKGLTKRILSDIPFILNHVIALTQKLPTAYLSNNYHWQSSEGEYITRFFVEEGKLYRMFFNSNDPVEGSYDAEVSREDLLSWMKGDSSRVLDVFNHLKEYIKKAPEYQKYIEKDHSESIEAMTRYP